VLGRVGDLLVGERLKFRVREQHCVNIVGDHHAGRRFIRELRVELETELLEEGHRALEVLHRQVYENLCIHGMPALGLRDWPEVRIRKPSHGPTVTPAASSQVGPSANFQRFDQRYESHGSVSILLGCRWSRPDKYKRGQKMILIIFLELGYWDATTAAPRLGLMPEMPERGRRLLHQKRTSAHVTYQ